MKGSKEDVAKALYDVADGIKEIADKILSEKYDPRDWVKVNDKLAPVVLCLQVQAEDFTSKE